MNEKPKSFWWKSRSVPPCFRRWLILLVAGFPTAFVVMVFFDFPRPWNELDALMFVVFVSLAMATSIVCLLPSIKPSLKWFSHWQNLRRVLFSVVCLVTLIALFYAEEDWRGWHAWSQFRHQWEAKGERFDLASVVPPPVPDDQNFAFAPVVFTSYGWLLDRNGHRLQSPNTNIINRMTMHWNDLNNGATNEVGDWTRGTQTDFGGLQQYYRTLATKTNLFPIPPRPGSPAADVLLALSPLAPTIEELRQATQLPYSRFPLYYDNPNPETILLPHLAGLKSSSMVLQVCALAELQTGQTDQALADIKLTLQLTDAVRNEPILISHLVRISIVELLMQPVWEGLARHQWSEAQLAELNASLAKLDLIADYELAWRGDRALQIGAVNYVRRHPQEYLNFFDGWQWSENPLHPTDDPIMALFAACRIIPSGWLYQNQLLCSRVINEFYLPTADVPARVFRPALARQTDAFLENERQYLSVNNILGCLLLSSPFKGDAVLKFAHAQSSVDLARVAIALERFRLAQGKFPDSLDALAPQFLNPVPLDVIGGKPLHYRLTEDGPFVLYSVGWNEKDDGGVVALRKGATPPVQDISQGDWVWSYRQP